MEECGFRFSNRNLLEITEQNHRIQTSSTTMILSALACPFFPSTTVDKLEVRKNCLIEAQATLSLCDFSLFVNILEEWESSPLLSILFEK